MTLHLYEIGNKSLTLNMVDNKALTNKAQAQEGCTIVNVEMVTV